MLDLNDLKQVFFEQETQAKLEQVELERLKAEQIQTKNELQQARLELAKAKEERQKQQQQARLELLQLKEQRQQQQAIERQLQALKQQKTDNITYITSITITFSSILASIILFITILLRG